MKRKMFFVILWAAGGLVFLAGLATVICNLYVSSIASPYVLTDHSSAPVCDAILVLGARVYASGQPSPSLSDRLDTAVDLYNAGKAPKILVSGDSTAAEYDETAGMLDYLLQRGIPRGDILVDQAGYSTYDSIYRTREQFGIRSVLIATQDFHIERSVYIARRLGLDAWGVPSPDRQAYWLYNRARESLARVKAVLETDILHRIPTA